MCRETRQQGSNRHKDERRREQRTKGERGFEMSQNSFMMSLNSVLHCVVTCFDEPCTSSLSLQPSPLALYSPKSSDIVKIRAGPLGFCALHCIVISISGHSLKIEKLGKFDVGSATISDGERKTECMMMWGEYTLCPSVVFLGGTQFILPVESSMSYCSL